MSTPPAASLHGLHGRPVSESSPLRNVVNADTSSPAPSFKKRTVSRGGLMNAVSSWARPRQNPGHIALPSNPFSESSAGGTSTPTGSGFGPREQGLLSPMSNATMRQIKSPYGEEPPSIPAAYPSVSPPQDSTPLPTITMFVLSICMLGE